MPPLQPMLPRHSFGEPSRRSLVTKGTMPAFGSTAPATIQGGQAMPLKCPGALALETCPDVFANLTLSRADPA